MANETITLPDLYERVQKACMSALVPRIRHDWNPHGAKRAKSWRSTNDFRLDDAEAEAIILAACVRWLADNGHQPLYCREGEPKKYTIWVRYGIDFARPLSDDNPTTAAALVEQARKEKP